MSNKTNFYYYVQDLDLLSKIRSINGKFISNANHVIFESLDKIDLNIKNGVFVIDEDLDFFQENFIEKGSEVILIVVNDIINDFHDYPKEVYISKSRVLTSLSAILYDLQNTVEFNSKYYSVDIQNIAMDRKSPCELYIRLSEEKFIKCLKTGDVFDLAIKEKYAAKTDFLWVEKADFYLYGAFLYGQDDLEAEVDVPFTVEKQDHLALIHEMAHSCGISERTMQAVENSLNEIKENPDKKIKDLLGKFEEMKGSFLYSHSYFTALLCVEVAKKQDWFKPQHLDKLTFAAIVHDLGYKDPKNALNESLPKSKVMLLDPIAKEDTLGHIDAVLEILEKSDSIDSDVINIIKRHHGGRGDESYPSKSYATEMDLLSGIFLLSHCFAISFFKMSFNPEKIEKVLAYIEVVYNKGNLKKIFPGFKKDVLALLK